MSFLTIGGKYTTHKVYDLVGGEERRGVTQNEGDKRYSRDDRRDSCGRDFVHVFSAAPFFLSPVQSGAPKKREMEEPMEFYTGGANFYI